MRYSAVGWTAVAPPRPRRRLGLFPCSRCRLPARERRILPRAVMLNRLAADFLVLMPFGRRIKLESLSYEKNAQYKEGFPTKQEFFQGKGRCELRQKFCYREGWPKRR